MGANSRDIKIEGLDQVLETLRKMPAEISARLEKRSLRRSLAKMKATAERLAPVDSTGSGSITDKPLADNFKISVRGKGKDYIIAQLKNTSPHAHLIELGFVHTGPKPGKKKGDFVKPQPFMTPALDQHAEETIEDFKNEVQAGLEKFRQKGKI